MRSIDDARDLNAILHNLYSNRQLLEFAQGPDWFDQQVTDVWTEWLKYGRYPGKPGSIQEFCNSIDTVDFNRACWELDNDYFVEEASE
jgi:hypothetical protein